MEVKVGKYTFVITENIESWNGITTNITPLRIYNAQRLPTFALIIRR